MTQTELPVVSIVMPLYNKAESVVAAIESVLVQSIADWELIVVDDGSTDDGPRRVQEFDDRRIYICAQRNGGVSAARNRGIELARADLIAFLDADDLWKPGFLGCVLKLRSDFPTAVLFATRYEIRWPDGTYRLARLGRLGRNFRRGIIRDYFSVAAVSDPPAHASAVAVKRTALDAVGGFPVGIASGEDLFTWARLALLGPVAYEDANLATFNMSGIERRPAVVDRVGEGLLALASANSSVPGLRKYLGLWCRMQAVMALRFGMRWLARAQAWRSVRWAPSEARGWYVFALSLLPPSIAGLTDGLLRRCFGGRHGRA